MKKLLSGILILGLCINIFVIANTTAVYANENITESTDAVEKIIPTSDYLQLPQEVVRYVAEKEDTIFGLVHDLMETAKGQKLSVELFWNKPYIICDMDTEIQYEVYYFPISDKKSGNIVYVATILMAGVQHYPMSDVEGEF